MSAPAPDPDLLALPPDARALLFTEARSANAFLDDPVGDEQLRAIYALSRWPPTMANSNPLRWLVVRDDEAKRRLEPHLAEGNRAKTMSAPVTVILAADVDFHELVPQLFPTRAHLRDTLAENPNREALARNNAWLQAGYFILAVRAAGLAAGPMIGFDAPGVDAEFLAGTSWRSILAVNVGRPAEGAWFDRLPRLDYEQVVREA